MSFFPLEKIIKTFHKYAFQLYNSFQNKIKKTLMEKSVNVCDRIPDRPIPERVPVPEAWGWELEYLIGGVCDRLDICKTYGCLLISLDVRHLIPRHSEQFMHCLRSGGNKLSEFVNKKFPADRNESSPTILVFQTPTLAAMTQACCLDDINMGHVFDLLRISELLDHNNDLLSLERRSEILCAIIGELDLIIIEFVTSNIANEPKKLEATQFLKGTQKILLDFISESGRDRATYMKEVFSRMALVPPRPKFYDINKTNEMSTSLKNDSYSKNTSLYHSLLTESRGDCYLEQLFHSGSLLSIWKRLHELWNAKGPRSKQSKHSYIYNQTNLMASIDDKIRWAIIRAVRHLNRFRRLMFTRFLEAICSPIWVPPLHNESIGSYHLTENSSELVQLIISAFLSEAKGTRWPYESHDQLQAFDRCQSLTSEMKQRLKEIICFPDSMHYIYTNDSDPPPELEAKNLFQQFLTDSHLNYQGDLLCHLHKVDINKTQFSSAVASQLKVIQRHSSTLPMKECV